jgi:hypothetical protein
LTPLSNDDYHGGTVAPVPDKKEDDMASAARTGQKLKVLNPMGYPPEITQLGMAPRFDTLEGKKVYLIDTRFDDGDRLLEQIEAWFKENMPSVETVFVSKIGVYTEDDPRLWEEIQRENAVAIMAVGH